MFSRYSLFIAACLILFALAPPPAVSQNLAAGWTVHDPTGAIALDSVEEHDSVLTMVFKNRSAAVITAVTLSFKEGAYHYQDWFTAEPSGCAPGQVFEIAIGPDESTHRKVRIAAVLFEDGSGKGDPSQLDRMNLHRFGQIMEATRIRNIFQGRTKSDDDAAIGNLSRKIGKMPNSVAEAFESLESVRVPGISLSNLKQHDEKARNALLCGLSITREGALRHLENVKQLPMVSPDEKTPSRGSFLSFIQDLYDKQNKKGVALLHRMQGGQ
jgi:hypothetical protein